MLSTVSRTDANSRCIFVLYCDIERNKIAALPAAAKRQAAEISSGGAPAARRERTK